MPNTFFGEILDLDAAASWRQAQKTAGRRVVFTNGCFDVLHAGHVAYLAWARAQGDALLLGLNSDASVRRLKGDLRPIVPFDERARILAALRSVDIVVGFHEATPQAMLDRLRPDIHVKSAQYREEDLPERVVVQGYGGRILLAPHQEGVSTSDTIARIVQRYSLK
ncbi:MAG: adenylyltransferase/cytidyltransferase family protein [Vulcanimicrobiaceae bacterium]